MFTRISEDIAAIRERDPAARSKWEILTCYPGLHALFFHRIAHACWNAGFLWFGRWLSHWGRFLTGIEIHPGAKIGHRVFIDHGLGVVIGETAEIGDDCTIYQGVTLGGTALNGGKRHPTLGRGVVVGAGAKVLGPITIGEGSRIGANAVVVRDVPPDVVVVGVPGEIVRRGWAAGHAPNLEHSDQPDVIAATLRSMMDRVAQLEHRLGDDELHKAPFTPSDGEWQAAEDFVI